MTRHRMVIRILSIVLFFLVLLVGFRLAAVKPLWNDEIYSQTSSVKDTSITSIFVGKIGEGNNSPLFYLLQKGVCGLLQYQSPLVWAQGTKTWDQDGLWDRYVLRVAPVFWTSLAMTAIFYFFAQYYSVALGGFSVFLSLSSTMLWNYWAEARPYSQWLFLSTLQILFFFYLTQIARTPLSKYLWILAGIHVALASTAVLSLPQIVVIVGLLWMYNFRDRRFVVLGLILPIAIGIYYYCQAPKYPFGLIFSIEQYIRAHISRDRFYLFGIGGVLLMVGWILKIKKINFFQDEWNKRYGAVAGVFFAMIAAAVLMLMVMKAQSGPTMQFPVTEKYFMFLTPVGIICATMIVDALWNAFKPLWCKGIVILVVAGLTVPKLIKVIKEVKEHYPLF